MPPQVAWLCVAGAVVLAAVAAWFGLPAGVVVAAGVIAAAVLHPSPELTGKHPVSKSPQPDGPAEQAQLDEHRFFTGWMNQLMNPVNVFWPRPATVVAWTAGVFAWMQPAAYGWVPAVSALAAALVVAGWCAAKRGVGEGGEPQPPVEFKSFPQVWSAGPGTFIGHGVAGAAAAAGMAWLLFEVASWQVVNDLRSGFAETVGGLPAAVMTVEGDLTGAVAGAAVFGAAWAVSVPWRKVALTHWRELMEFRAEWRPRWEQLKMTEPRLQDFRLVGDATVFTFDTQGKGTSAEFIDLMARGKLAAMLDSTVTHVATTVPIVGKDGQPQPGTVSPTGFEYTAWPEGLPSLMVVGDDDVMRHALACAMSQVAQQAALPVPHLDQFVSLRTMPQPGEPGMWATTWMGVHGATLRGMLAGGLGQLLRCHIVADNRTFGGAGTVYLGDFSGQGVADGPRVDLAGGLTAEQDKEIAKAGTDEAALVEASWKVLNDLQLEDQWEATWKDALKQTVNPPTIRHFHHKADKLANGKVVEQQAFSVRLGMDPYEYMNQKVETALANGATPRPFLVVTPWLMAPERDSECHGSLLVVHSSTDRVPTISKLAPVDGSSAPQSVLTGYVVKAFDHARLARPTVAKVECMTSAGSREHVWRIRLWLYGGVTLADVRKAERKLQSAMGVEWLRVGQEGRNCVIVAGVDPTNRSVRLAKPDYRRQLLAYDWAALWSDAGVVSQSGELPRLLEAAQMPQNDLVTRMVFTIPPGKSVASMRAQQAKLSSASKNAFVDIRQSKRAADQVELLVAKESPMPFPAPLDFDEEFDPTHIPYATGVDGVPVVLNRDRVAHLGVFGSSGGGKSAAAQTILTGALLAGCEVYVADVQKQAADFKYAEPWLSGIATTGADVLATMEHLYAEKDRRVALNSKYGAGHCRELPDEVRPPTIWFFVDEFFGMVQKAKPAPKPEADPELEAARQELAREYDTAKRIAFLTGRFAAEARSADIHLVVMTQKLTKDMLDSSAAGPGALSDLKDIDLDARLPVPVSDRFPDGWARNRELQIGDMVYARDGSLTPIIKFSPTLEGHDVYEVVFDDGQKVVAGHGHLWKVSNATSRRRGASMPHRRWLDLLETADPSEYVTGAQVSEILGSQCKRGPGEALINAGVQPWRKDVLTGVVEPVRRDWREPSTEYEIGRVIDMSHGLTRLNMSPLEQHRGKWGSFTELVTCLRTVEQPGDVAGTLHGVLHRIGRQGRPTREGRRVYSLHDLLMALCLRDGPQGERELVVDHQVIRTTQELFDSKDVWAVDVAEAVEGEELDLPIDPYVLGVWLGDGASAAATISVGDGPNSTDEDGLTDMEHLIGELQRAGYGAHKLGCGPNLVGTHGLKKQLRLRGLVRNKHIPAEYLRASKEQRLALLQGLMDSDGTCYLNGRAAFTNTNGLLAEQVLELARSLGTKATLVSWDTPNSTTGSVTHNVSFLTTLPVFRLPRKRARLRTELGNASCTRRTIVAINKVEPRQTRCIGVAHPEHLFLVEGFIPTHNTNLNVLLLGKTKIGDRASALRAWEDAPDLGEQVPPGRGVFEPVDDAMQIVQVWYASTGEHVEVLSAELDPVEKVDLAPYRAKERNTSGFVELGGQGVGGVELVADVDGGVEVVELEVDVSEFDFSFLEDGASSDVGSAGGMVADGLDLGVVPVEIADFLAGADPVDDTDAEADAGIGLEAAPDDLGASASGRGSVPDDRDGGAGLLAGDDQGGAGELAASSGWGLPEPDEFFQELGFTGGADRRGEAPAAEVSAFDRAPVRVTVPPAEGWGWDEFPAAATPVVGDDVIVDDGLLDDVFRPAPDLAVSEERDLLVGHATDPDAGATPDAVPVVQGRPEDSSDLDEARERSRKRVLGAASGSEDGATAGAFAPARPGGRGAATGRKLTPAQRRRSQNAARTFLPDDALDDDFEPRTMPDPLGEAAQIRALPGKQARTLTP